MFSRKSCYFFVRPKKSYLEVVRLSRPRAEGSAGQARRRSVEVEGRQLHSHHAPRRSRAADHRLASGSVPVDHEENDHEESHDEIHEENREEASKETEAALARPQRYTPRHWRLRNPWPHSLVGARADGQRDGGRLLCAASSARSRAQYVYRAADRRNERPSKTADSIPSRTRSICTPPRRASFALGRAPAVRPRRGRRRCGRR